MEYFFSGFAMILQLKYILYMFGGVFMGTVLGFLPGLNAAMGIALMLPLTYTMPSLDALVFLASIYTGGLFGGAVTAILINTPGSNANIATTLDGYPMQQKGESERALGLALCSSMIGGLIGMICLTLIAAPMAKVALKFGPAEMFMVAFFGLTVVGSLSDDVVKSLFSGLVGLLLGTIGINDMGIDRGTMGSIYLIEGLPLIPALIGFLALPAIYELAAGDVTAQMTAQRVSLKKLLNGCHEVFRHPIQALLCSLTGVVIGIMPAAGASIAGIFCYNQSKQFSKNPKNFGTGIAEGIIACETANNASEGGALATMFVLGIPGSNATAMMLGAVVLMGWTPGPRMFSQYSDIIYTVFSSLFIQQFVMMFFGVLLCLLATRLSRISVKYLAPTIIMLTMVGAFSSGYNLFDPSLMIGCSVLGWFMKRYDYPVMPLVLGILLGDIADAELMRILQSFDHFYEIFTRPIVLLLLTISAFSVVLPQYLRWKRVRTAKTA